MNRTNVELIKERLPVEEVLSAYIKLEKAGKSYKAKCPFHNEKSASFFVSPERGGYYCFGCGAKGDIFTFVEQFEGLDFKGALKVLADKAGVPLVHDVKADSERDQLFKVMESAAQYFEFEYARSKEAQAYVKGRGITEETRKTFRIGWVPDAWRNLSDHLKKLGYSEMLIEKAGLIKQSEKGIGYRESQKGIVESQNSASDPKPYTLTPTATTLNPLPSRFYDRFRGRVMFPITDSSGRVVAFTGRILKEDEKSAKYLNSPETPLFSKSSILFGLDKAKADIRRLNYSILVEGQMDLVLSHQAGVKNVIAASGTALTDQATGTSGAVNNLGMVRRLSGNMIIALDSDKAGRAAAMKAVAATALSMGMSVKIADIEGGKDPADLILHNPEDWKNVLKNAKHVIEFELGNVIKETTDPHKLAKAVRDRVFPYLVRIDSEMDKAYYVRIIAERTGLSESAVWEDLKKVKVEQPANSAAPAVQKAPIPSSSAQMANRQGVRRLDLVERRLFGLLALMEQEKSADASTYRNEIKKIAGDSFAELEKRIAPLLGDIAFEADSFYGQKKEHWDYHMKELLLNFEEDMVNDDLLSTMTELRMAERDGNKATVEELTKKCQALSIRKAEIARKKRG